MKYTKEILQTAADCSNSIAGVLRHLELKQAGGTHHHISKKLKEFNIDTSHFLGQRSNCGGSHNGGPKKKTHKEILILRTSGNRAKRTQLVRALKEIRVPYICSECKIEPWWNKKELTIQVDHVDGNWLDNRKENLRFLCPNCHSQTENFSKPGRVVERQTRSI